MFTTLGGVVRAGARREEMATMKTLDKVPSIWLYISPGLERRAKSLIDRLTFLFVLNNVN